MITLYVYDEDTMRVLATITRETDGACHEVAADNFCLGDGVATTFSPAFGTVDGLNDPDAETEEL